jgi:hypothetical protein
MEDQRTELTGRLIAFTEDPEWKKMKPWERGTTMRGILAASTDEYAVKKMADIAFAARNPLTGTRPQEFADKNFLWFDVASEIEAVQEASLNGAFLNYSLGYYPKEYDEVIKNLREQGLSYAKDKLGDDVRVGFINDIQYFIDSSGNEFVIDIVKDGDKRVSRMTPLEEAKKYRPALRSVDDRVGSVDFIVSNDVTTPIVYFEDGWKNVNEEVESGSMGIITVGGKTIAERRVGSEARYYELHTPTESAQYISIKPIFNPDRYVLEQLQSPGLTSMLALWNAFDTTDAGMRRRGLNPRNRSGM